MKIPVRRWRHRWRSWWAATRRGISSLRRAAAAPFHRAGKLANRTVRLVVKWWRSRTTRLLLQGLPAIVAALGVSTLALAIALSGLSASEEADYLGHALRCMQTDQPADALTSYERLLQLDPGRPEYLFGVARATAEVGQNDRALALMKELAPENRTGYGPAHFWLARWLLQQPPSPELTQGIENHLVRALSKQAELNEKQAEALEAHVLLAQLYVATNRLQMAEPHLLQGIRVRPDMRIGLIVLYRRLGQHELADMHAKQARDYFQALAEAHVDNQLARRLWAEAEVLRGDFPQAVRVLQQGLQLSRTPMFRQALADVFGLWSDTLNDGVTTKFGNRVALIEQGLGYDPANVNLLRRLLALTKPPRPEVIPTLGASLIAFGASPLRLGPVAGCPALIFLQTQNDPRQARAVLQQLLARGQAPAMVHLTLGLDAWEQGKGEDARRHWEQAYQLDPSLALVGNNLAWVLATQEPTDLPRALQLIDSVLKREPNEPDYHGTRGQILVRMKRWQEGLNELMVSLKAKPDKPETHAALAQAYAELGFAELAAKHKELAQKKK